MSICEVVEPGFVWIPPSSAASRAACRTAEPAVTRSAIMMVASKPPIKRKKSTGITTAISASDCPRRGWVRRSLCISVALRLQSHIDIRCRLDRPERGEEAGLPGVRVLDRHADEVAGAVAHVAGGRRPGLGRNHRRPIQRIPVVPGGIGGQISVAILVELVDVNLADVEESRRADVVADDLQ